MAEKKTLTLTEENFASEVLESERPVLVDFWADWCAPCRQAAPIIEELARSFEGKATVAKVHVDEQPRLAERYQIRSIPSLLFFKDGERVDEVIGLAPKRALREKLDRLVADA